MDPHALARRIAANPLFRARALHEPHQLLQDWRLEADRLHDAARIFAALPVDDEVRRVGHAALFALLAAAPSPGNE